MALTLTEDETLLTDTLSAFLADAAPVSAFRALRDAGGAPHHDAALWSQMCAMGLPGIFLPEAEGGAGADYAAAGLIAERIGHVLAASPFLSTVVAIDLLRRADATRHTALIRALTTGERIAAFAVDERARHAPGIMDSTIRPSGDALVLDGGKRMVADGAGADFFLVAAKSEEGLALALVPRNASGVALSPLALVDSRDWADLRFDATPLPADALIAVGESAGGLIRQALDLGRLLLAFELLGIAQEAFDRTLLYLGEREQFGVKIGSFQALQHRAARLHIALEVVRSVVLKAARSLDAGDPEAPQAISLAKLHATRTAWAVLDEAVQMHGGIGVTDELDIGLFLKRARTAGALFGDDAFHRRSLGRSRFGW